MHRRKFTFYADETDVASFFEQMGSAHSAVFVATRSPGAEPVLLDEQAVGVARHSLILPYHLIGALRPHPSLSGEGYFLNVLLDPVIEFKPSRWKSGLLTSARLYFVPQYVENGQYIPKPDAIQAFSDEVLSWARQWVERAGGKPCGPNTAIAVQEGLYKLGNDG